MAVTGKAHLLTQIRQVVIEGERVQRPGKPQAQLIAIQGQPFYLLENLREITTFGVYFKSPTTLIPKATAACINGRWRRGRRPERLG